MLRRAPRKPNDWRLFTYNQSSGFDESKLNFIVDKMLQTAPAESRTTQADFLKIFLKQNWNLIEKLQNPIMQENWWVEFVEAANKNDQERILSIVNRFKLPTREQYEPPSVLASFFKTIAPFFAASLFPSLSVPIAFLSMVMPNLAQVTEKIDVHSGTPEGLDGICHGNCVQGWLSTLSQPILARFNAIKEQTRSINLGALWQLNRCVSAEKVGEIAAQTFQNTPVSAPNATQAHCTAQSAQIYGYQVTADLLSVPQEICNAFQSDFRAGIDPCMDASKAIGLNVAVTVIILAGIAVLACASAAAFYGTKYACEECSKPSCC